MSDSEPTSQVAPVKRGRGRPRKDPSATPAKKSDSASNGATKGKRGRKPGSTNKPKPANSETGVKRGRGRPRKSDAEKTPKKKAKKAESSESEQQDNSSVEESDE